MSTYNESASDLKESIESIIKQTYTDFEFIIVNDNPSNKELKHILNKYQKQDKRIILIENDTNMGLAMSLNRAAQKAKGEYLLRMDADDVSYTNRFQIELETLVNGNYDLVCSTYDVIDEKSNIIEYNKGTCSDKSLRSILPFKVIIHHPTVLMKKDKFEKIGGYRNFKCAQDYDLWLRMWNADYKMHLIDKPLIQYRHRKESVSFKKRYLQHCTGKYIRELFHERLIKKQDSYSYSNYLKFVENLGANDKSITIKFLIHNKILVNANKHIDKGHVIIGLILRLLVFIISKSYRHGYFINLKTKVLISKPKNLYEFLLTSFI